MSSAGFASSKTTDKNHWNQQAETIATQSHFILTSMGQPLQGGITFMGKQYTLYTQDNLLYILANGRGKPPAEIDRQVLPHETLAPNCGIILKQENDKISPTSRITSADAIQFGRFVERIRERMVGVQVEVGIDR